jgi:hypothetical protein
MQPENTLKVTSSLLEWVPAAASTATSNVLHDNGENDFLVLHGDSFRVWFMGWAKEKPRWPRGLEGKQLCGTCSEF